MQEGSRPEFDIDIGQLLMDNITMRQDLSRSIQTIDALKSQLAEYDVLLAHAQCIYMNPTFTPAQFEKPSSQSRSASLGIDTDAIWIDDIWLCANSKAQCLRDAERQWQEQRSRLAMEMILQAIHTDPFLSPAEEIRCRLFVAAVMHSRKEYEESTKTLNLLLEMLSGSPIFNRPPYDDLVGIVYFIRGRNLMEQESFIEAYISLSRALGVPGYHDKAREFQRQTITSFTMKHTTSDGLCIL